MTITNRNQCVIFNQLLINAIENTSGVFIGDNYASYWSTYTKSNYGFGKVSNSQVSDNISIVFDEDVVDAPVTGDRVLLNPGKPAANQHQQYNVAFKNINANSLNTNSVISVGDNEQNLWESNHKNNYGHGKSYGINSMKNLTNTISDRDCIDAPIKTNNFYA